MDVLPAVSGESIGNAWLPGTMEAERRAIARESASMPPDIGEVAKRSNAADCKSVALAASEVRILPSPPAFARFAGQHSASFGWQAS